MRFGVFVLAMAYLAGGILRLDQRILLLISLGYDLHIGSFLLGDQFAVRILNI